MATGVETARPIVGREAELAAVEDFLAGIAHGPRALRVDGEPGIGKTTVWKHALERASELGYDTLVTRPAAPEARLSFAGLGDLLDGQLEGLLDDLPGPQRHALETALLLNERRAESSHRPLGPAVLSSLRLLAARSPVLVAIDDVQWLDAPSAGILRFAARRLTSEHVGLALTSRSGSSPGGLWDEREVRTTRVELGPLTLGAIHRVLHTRLGMSLPRPTLRRVVEVSGGNPFFALEIARALRRTDTHAIDVPDNLHELVLERLVAMPAATERALLVLSVLSRPTVELLGRALSDDLLDPVLQPAVDAAVIEVHRDRIRFAHPLLASAIYSQAAPGRRREVHRELAELVDDPEERARHLALATIAPDGSVALALDDGAARAFARGAPDSAAELAELALELTPADNVEGARARHMAAAEYHFEGGNSTRALALLDEALANETVGRPRAVLLSRLARIRGEVEGPAAGLQLLRTALREDVDDPATEAAVHHRLARLTMLCDDVRSASKYAEAAVALAEHAGDQVLLAQTLATHSMIEFRLGRGTRPDLIERAIELERARPRVWIDESPSAVHGAQLLAMGDLDGARATFEGLRARAAEHEDASVLTTLFYLGMTEIRAGRWELADRHIAEAVAITRQSGREAAEPPCLVAATFLAAVQGKIDETLQLAAETIEVSERTLQPFWAAHARSALGLLELSLGNAAGAHEQLAPSLELMLNMGVKEPGFLTALPDDVEALVTLGSLDEATALLEPFERRAHRLRRTWALAAAARCRALMALAQGASTEAVLAAESALARARPVQLPLERGRTLLVLGTAQRHARQLGAARESLTAAAALFDELGSPLWAARAAEELARIGGRRRAAGELTAAERKVAQLVCEGRSNKEVAGELFVTVRTVEGHLTNVYEKLGVRSRAELARRFTG